MKNSYNKAQMPVYPEKPKLNEKEIERLKRKLADEEKLRLKTDIDLLFLKDKIRRLMELLDGTPPAGSKMDWEGDLEEAKASYLSKKKDLMAIDSRIKNLEQRIEELQTERVAGTEKAIVKTSLNDETIPETASGKTQAISPDPLDKSIFGGDAGKSALQPTNKRRQVPGGLDRLGALKPVKSVLADSAPKKNSLDETLYPKMTAQREADRFVRRRKDGQPKSREEILFPSQFADDDYDLVEIDPIEPFEPAEDQFPFRHENPFSRKKKKKPMF